MRFSLLLFFSLQFFTIIGKGVEFLPIQGESHTTLFTVCTEQNTYVATGPTSGILTLGGSSIGTGSLIKVDGVPYCLTAGHCVSPVKRPVSISGNGFFQTKIPAFVADT